MSSAGPWKTYCEGALLHLLVYSSYFLLHRGSQGCFCSLCSTLQGNLEHASRNLYIYIYSLLYFWEKLPPFPPKDIGHEVNKGTIAIVCFIFESKITSCEANSFYKLLRLSRCWSLETDFKAAVLSLSALLMQLELKLKQLEFEFKHKLKNFIHVSSNLP